MERVVKRHRLDLVSLVPGAVFVAIAVASLRGWDVTRIDYAWFWPAIAIGVAVVLIAGLLRGRE
jgi:hypothetical protein